MSQYLLSALVPRHSFHSNSNTQRVALHCTVEEPASQAYRGFPSYTASKLESKVMSPGHKKYEKLS